MKQNIRAQGKLQNSQPDSVKAKESAGISRSSIKTQKVSGLVQNENGAQEMTIEAPDQKIRKDNPKIWPVLKAKSIKFVPQLPRCMRRHIQTLGMGQVNTLPLVEMIV